MAFWEDKSLAELDDAEWEALCDGCGQCCLHKLQDANTGQVAITSIACALLDIKTCRCRNYPERTRLVPDCVDLRRRDLAEYLAWLPKTCAYRLRAQGQDLPPWHPLVSGDQTLMKATGRTVSAYAQKLTALKATETLQDYVVEWLD